MRGDALPVLLARGLLAAARTWKALLLALVLNAALALVVTAPLASRLNDLLDERPTVAPLAKGWDLVLGAHLLRAEPGLLGERDRLDALGRGELPLEELPRLSGPLAGLLAAGLLHAALSALLAGGFAGRFAAERDRGSLGAFLADVVRLGLWLLFAPSVGGGDLRLLALLVAGQQVIVLLRITARAAHLGAASAWMRGAREASRPAPAKIEP